MVNGHLLIVGIQDGICLLHVQLVRVLAPEGKAAELVLPQLGLEAVLTQGRDVVLRQLTLPAVPGIGNSLCQLYLDNSLSLYQKQVMASDSCTYRISSSR